MQASSDMVEEPKQPVEIERGRVNWFGALKGYGFIRRDGGRGDVFVHHTAIVTWNKQSEEETRPVLHERERVEFEVVISRTGKPAARNVRVVTE